MEQLRRTTKRLIFFPSSAKGQGGEGDNLIELIRSGEQNGSARINLDFRKYTRADERNRTISTFFSARTDDDERRCSIVRTTNARKNSPHAQITRR